MKKVRIGNDIIVEWAILSAGEPVDLVGRNIELNLRNIKTVIPITDFIITGNIISFQFAGKDQQELGTYSLTLIENNHNEDMHTVDTCNAFQLVASTCKIYDEECDCFSPCTIHLSSDIHIYDGPISARMIPPGGKAGQVLKKKSDKDFDDEWGDDEGIKELAPGAVKRENLSQEVLDEIDSKPGRIVPATGVDIPAEVFNAACQTDPEDANESKPGRYSHAENINTFAGGEGAHAENIETRAMAYGSHAEGNNTEVKSSAKFGHAGGSGSIVESEAGFAHGVNAVSKNRGEAVFGKNNDPDTTGKSMFQVGIGSNKNNPKTGFQIDSDGTIWVINTNTGSRISLQSWLNDIQLKKIVVDQLPEAGAPSTVYLLRVTAPDESRHNFFEEYIYIDGAWEMLGTSDSDESIIERILSNPAFKVESQQIADNAIQAKHLSEDCVTSDSIQGGAVLNEKIAPKSITHDKIADGAIGRYLLSPELQEELDTLQDDITGTHELTIRVADDVRTLGEDLSAEVKTRTAEAAKISADLNSEIQERINGDQSIREHLYSIENALNRTVKTTKQQLTTTQQEQTFSNLGIKTVYLDYATDVGKVLPEELIARIADASRIVLDDPNIGRLVLQLGFVDSRSRYFITVRSNGTLYRGVMNSETRVFHTETLSFVDQSSVKFDVSQNLTDNNKKIARTNIGAMADTPSGDPMHHMYELAGAVWNASTGFWELNELTDLTTGEMQLIYQEAHLQGSGVDMPGCFAASNSRTNISLNSGSVTTSLERTFYARVQYVTVKVVRSGLLWCNNINQCFYQCRNLETVIGVIRIAFANAVPSTTFFECFKLKTISLQNLSQNVSFPDSPFLSLESLQYMVNNASNTSAITITVHADVYAKLTGDTTNSAAAALTEEELAQWAQVLTDAMAKNISFATA